MSITNKTCVSSIHETDLRANFETLGNATCLADDCLNIENDKKIGTARAFKLASRLLVITERLVKATDSAYESVFNALYAEAHHKEKFSSWDAFCVWCGGFIDGWIDGAKIGR